MRWTAKALGWAGVGGLLCAASCSSSSEPPGDLLPQLGGQSGGDGSELAAFCACSSAASPEGAPASSAAVARLSRSAGGCAELELLQVWNPERGFEVGDTVGGAIDFACSPEPPAAVGDLLFIREFQRGGQDSYACVEYLACSAELCGEPPRQGPPDTRYEACDAACAEQTREACAAHANEAALDGYASVLRMQGDAAVFDWAGQERRETPDELLSPECFERQRAQLDAWQATSAANEAASAPALHDDDGASPEAPTCPVPAAP